MKLADLWHRILTIRHCEVGFGHCLVRHQSAKETHSVTARHFHSLFFITMLNYLYNYQLSLANHQTDQLTLSQNLQPKDVVWSTNSDRGYSRASCAGVEVAAMAGSANDLHKLMWHINMYLTT